MKYTQPGMDIPVKEHILKYIDISDTAKVENQTQSYHRHHEFVPSAAPDKSL